MFKWVRELRDSLERGRRFVTHDVWHIGRPGEPAPQGFIIKHIRVTIVLAQNLVQDALLLRASALTFATALSIVPLLIFMFAIVQAIDLDQEIYRYMSGHLVEDDAEFPREPDESFLREGVIDLLMMRANGNEAGNGEEDGEGDELGETLAAILAYAEERADFQTLGLAGLGFILATLFGLMKNIESSFNKIWGLKSSRGYFRKIADYLVLLLLMPFVVIPVITLFAILESEVLMAQLGPFSALLRGFQYVIVWASFTALYYFVPNTRVVFRYALIAGILAGTLWYLVSMGYVKFQFGLARYNIIYTSYFAVPMLLMWVYASWVVVLSGAELTFAYQNEKTFAMERYAEGASQAYREATGLRAMIEIGHRFEHGQPPLSTLEAAEAWNVPSRLINETLDILQDAGLVTQCVLPDFHPNDPPRYQPACSLDRITVSNVILALREAGRDPSELRQDQRFNALLDEINAGRDGTMERTIGELVRSRQYVPLALESPETFSTRDASAKPHRA